jgi:hypothetical protein
VQINFKMKYLSISLFALLISCTSKQNEVPTTSTSLPIQGTWQLIDAMLIEKGDTSVTIGDKGVKFIKIINDSHFAFMQHDLNHGKDTSALYSSGAGTYTLKGDEYTEHLEFCGDRTWEDHDFTFKVTIKNDTFIQTGVEKVVEQGIERINTERYVRIKK